MAGGGCAVVLAFRKEESRWSMEPTPLNLRHVQAAWPQPAVYPFGSQPPRRLHGKRPFRVAVREASSEGRVPHRKLAQ